GAGPAGARERGDEAGAADALDHRHLPVAQLAGDEAGGLVLLEAEFRGGMELPAPGRHLGLELADRRVDLHAPAFERRRCARACSQAMAASRIAEKVISSTATEAIAGLIDSRTPEKIMRGSVRSPATERKLATTTSSNEMMKAMIAPVTTP